MSFELENPENESQSYASIVKHFTLYDAIICILAAWTNVSVEVIKNSFNKATELLNVKTDNDLQKLSLKEIHEQPEQSDCLPYDITRAENDEQYLENILAERVPMNK